MSVHELIEFLLIGAASAAVLMLIGEIARYTPERPAVKEFCQASWPNTTMPCCLQADHKGPHRSYPLRGPVFQPPIWWDVIDGKPQVVAEPSENGTSDSGKP